MSEAPEHLVKSYDQELNRLLNLMTQMAGSADNAQAKKCYAERSQ